MKPYMFNLKNLYISIVKLTYLYRIFPINTYFTFLIFRNLTNFLCCNMKMYKFCLNKNNFILKSPMIIRGRSGYIFSILIKKSQVYKLIFTSISKNL